MAINKDLIVIVIIGLIIFGVVNQVNGVSGDTQLRLNDVAGDSELYMDFFILDGIIYVVNPIETFELMFGGGGDLVVSRGFDKLLFQMKLYDDIYYEGELVTGSVQYELPEKLLNQKFQVNYWLTTPEGVDLEILTADIDPKVHGIKELSLQLAQKDVIEGTWKFNTELILNGVAKNEEYTEFEVSNHISTYVIGGTLGVMAVIVSFLVLV